MELTTSWKEEGRVEGRQEGRMEGRSEGRQEGEAALLIRQVRRRWGGLSPALEAQVRALPVEQLERLGEDLLDFASPADLQAWLNALGRMVDG